MICFAIYGAEDIHATERTFEYDKSGHISRVTYPDKNVISYEYDLLGRPIKVLCGGKKYAEFHYDAEGLVTAMKDEIGTTSYTYNTLNRLIKVAYPGTDPVHYEWDVKGRLSKVIYQKDFAVSYTYDLADKLLSVLSPKGETRYLYDELANTLTKVILPNKCVTEYAYDAAKRIRAISHKTADGTLLRSFTYLFDKSGNLSSAQEWRDGKEYTTHYSYDKLGQLLEVNRDHSFERYTYDSFGNRLTKQTLDSTIHYQYNSINQLVKAGDKTFSYDLRGNLIKKITPEQTCYYTYDGFNRLIAYQDKKNKVIYTYDGTGVRVAKTVNGKKTSFVCDAVGGSSQVLFEIAPDKKVKNSYIYGAGRIGQVAAKESHFYLHDAPCYNVVALVNEKQEIVSDYTYDAFGSPEKRPQEENNPFMYAGEAYEPESGLVYLRNRYYDPEIGRFLSLDPSPGKLHDPITFNPYVYVKNNPVNLVDPLGYGEVVVAVYPGGTETKLGEKSFAGHAFIHTIDDAGKVTKMGIHPGANTLRLDEIVPGTFTRSFPATDEQIGVIHSKFDSMTYNGIMHNCVDAVKEAMVEVGVKLPACTTMGISNPIKLALHIEELNGKTDLRDCLKAEKNFVAAPDHFHCPASRPQPPLPSHIAVKQADVGGVSFNYTAKVLGSLGNIVGATYDSTTGQLILVGEQTYPLPPMDFDDLAVAVRSIYGLGGKPPHDPGVSIDPDLADRAYQKVRYEGATENTHFGKVMFEADYLLKQIAIGKDPAGNAIEAKSLGGASLFASLINEGIRDCDYRFWFVPRAVSLTKTGDGKSFIFDQNELEIRMELKGAPSSRAKSLAEEFTYRLNQNLNGLAKEYPIFNELKRLAKITAVVKWMKENSIPIDLELFRNYLPKVGHTPNRVKSALNARLLGGILYCTSGGVTYTFNKSNFHEKVGDEAALMAEATEARPNEDAVSWPLGDGLRANAQTLVRMPKVGAVRKTFTDFYLAISGAFPLEINRYYNSFNERASGFGVGWDVLPAQVAFPEGRGNIRIICSGGDMRPYSRVILRFEGREYLYIMNRVVGDYATYQSKEKSAILKEFPDGTFILEEHPITMHFDNLGRLIQKRDAHGEMMRYEYGGLNLTAVLHSSGKRVSLEYSNGKICALVAPGGKRIVYDYDNQGQIASLSDGLGPLAFYQYDEDKNLSKILDPRKQVCFQATYDHYHRATHIKSGKNSLEKSYSLKDHSEAITSQGAGKLFNQYDKEYRLLRSKDSRGKELTFCYQGNSSEVNRVQDDLGHELAYTYDNKGNVTSIKNSMGNLSKFFYDENNRLIALQHPNGLESLYTYDGKGRMSGFFPLAQLKQKGDRLSDFSFEPNESISYEWDDKGNLATIKRSGDPYMTFSYDGDGKLVESINGSGYSLKRAYDERLRLSRIYDKLGSTEYHYNERNQITRVSGFGGTIAYKYDDLSNLVSLCGGSGGETRFTYDESGNLIEVHDALGGITRYGYSESNRLSKLTFSNGSSQEIEYDSEGRLVRERLVP